MAFFSAPAVATAFRVVAVAEACSWAGLLVGMLFKYLIVGNEIGVQVFGPIHGGVFIAFVVAAFFAGVAFKWYWRTWLWALLGSIVPLGSVIFVSGLDRTGRLGETTGNRSAVAAAVLPD